MENRLFTDSDGMDEDSCLAIYGNDYEFYKLVLKTFHEEIMKTVEGLQNTYDSGDVENYRIMVHGLKGSGGSAGATHLVDLATKSNALIKEGKWEESQQYHEPIIAELNRLIDMIPERIKAHNA